MRTIAPKSLATAGLILLSTFAATAQKRWDNYRETEFSEPPGFSLGVVGGLSDLWGDVGTQSPLHHYTNDKYWKSPRFMGGMYLRYTAVPALAFRLQAAYGRLYANDNWNEERALKAQNIEEDAFQRYLRNQDARSRIWEGMFMLEFMPLRMNPESGAARRRFQPYVGTGVAAFNFKTQTTWTSRPGGGGGGYGQWVDIYDLRLEGDGYSRDGIGLADAPSRYERWQVAVPLTLGVRWDIGRELGFGLEYCYRLTFTDYLDGVSGEYINPIYHSLVLPADRAAIARDVADKSWQILPDAVNPPGTPRGNPGVNDGYSTISVNFFYKIKSRKSPWWL